MKAKKKRALLNISMFNKLFISYLVAILIPTIIISSYNFYTFSTELKESYRSAQKESLQYMSKQMEVLVDSIHALSLQLSLSSDINTMITQPELNLYEANLVNKHLRNQMTTSDMFYSMYLYMKVSDTVLTTNEGLFKRADFYDKALLDRLTASDGRLSGDKLRILQDSSGVSPAQVFTFTRGVPPLNSYPLGQLVINVKKDAMIQSLYTEQSAGGHIMILDSGGHVVYDNLDEGAVPGTDGPGLASKEYREQSITEIGGKTYFTYGTKLDGINWTLVRFDPYEIYAQKLGSKLLGIVTIDLTILMTGLLISYLLSSHMYEPWRKIMAGLSGYFKQPSKLPNNESVWVTEAIASLIDENTAFQDTIKRSEPVMKDRFIYDILNRNYSQSLNITEKLKDMGITFDLPCYLVMIASFDPHECADEAIYDRKLLMFSYIKSKFEQQFRVAGTVLEQSDLGFILNVEQRELTDSLKSKLSECCREVHGWVQQELRMTLQFTFGNMYVSISEVHESYEQARRVFTYKPVIHKEDIAFYADLKRDARFEYPMSIQKQLLYSIASRQREAAVACIAELFEHYIYSDKYQLESLHEMIILLTSAVKNKLLEEGLEMEAVQDQVRVSQIFACSNNDQLHDMMLRYIQRLFDALDAMQDNKSNHHYISKAMDYIEQNYMRSISISDIAGHLGLSSSYLSRFFKAETGKSPLEHLTEFRIAKSKELLMSNEYTLQQISEQIGYPDVNSFIRYFKKYEGTTPGKYRSMVIPTI
ncbi:helix-turn-helix domain-containing protein [Paenibacillus allorhizosphaerae]|uniref:HTH-type transcriptional activator RhaS n=1 Tax=Paenibacillus allorhizosphaerae TaxID=2849866 RepID=A0ABM8VM68_9BACL|nr:helix-turn-helix domain-containing protein [Paenibacillus allorhizosphaerae]CAG7649307.1 HTH-type transcriptional activator RhaS [Paenibacillus allorhizosphaerae]